jgi:hypothetical protein
LALSIIRKKGEIQRGEQVPSDGSLALPEGVVMEPLGLEGLLNTNLDIQVFTPTRGREIIWAERDKYTGRMREG